VIAPDTLAVETPKIPDIRQKKLKEEKKNPVKGKKMPTRAEKKKRGR